MEGGWGQVLLCLTQIGPPNSSLTLLIMPKVIRIDLAHIFDFFQYGGTIVLLLICLTGRGGHFVLRNTVCSPNQKWAFYSITIKL